MRLNRGFHGWAQIIQKQNETAKTKPIANQRVNLIELPSLIRVNLCNPWLISSELLRLTQEIWHARFRHDDVVSPSSML